MTYFDTHAHLDDEAFEEDRDAVIARSCAAGVETILCVGISADSSEAAVRLAEKYEQVYAAVGIQPNYCAEAKPDDWQRIIDLTEHPRVIAIGETGLDRHWDFTPFEMQQDYFDRHLHLAADRNLPFVVHCRECETDVLAMLEKNASQKPLRGLLHAFSGSAELAQRCLEWGMYISFAGMVTYRNKKFAPLQAVAATIPDDRLLLETDSPYLTPHPLRGKQKRNEPAEVVLTASYLAELRGCDLSLLATQTTANAKRLFWGD